MMVVLNDPLKTRLWNFTKHFREIAFLLQVIRVSVVVSNSVIAYKIRINALVMIEVITNIVVCCSWLSVVLICSKMHVGVALNILMIS